MFAIGGCSAKPPTNTCHNAANPHRIAYPDIDSGLSEKLYPNEKVIAEQIAEVIEKSIRKQYALGSARRDAHPKAHG